MEGERYDMDQMSDVILINQWIMSTIDIHKPMCNRTVSFTSGNVFSGVYMEILRTTMLSTTHFMVFTLLMQEYLVITNAGATLNTFNDINNTKNLSELLQLRPVLNLEYILEYWLRRKHNRVSFRI